MDRRTGSRASRAPRFSPSRFELRRRWGPQLNFDLATTTGHTVFIEQAPRIYTTAGVLAFVCGHGNPRAEGSFTLDAKGPTKSLLEIGSQITSRINPLSVFKGAAGKLRRMRGPSTSKKMAAHQSALPCRWKSGHKMGSESRCVRILKDAVQCSSSRDLLVSQRVNICMAP